LCSATIPVQIRITFLIDEFMITGRIILIVIRAIASIHESVDILVAD
jgi:hypothetical protein